MIGLTWTSRQFQSRRRRLLSLRGQRIGTSRPVSQEIARRDRGWTSPTGEIYRTTPGGLDLFPDMALSSACGEPKPVPRNHSRQRAARVARIRRHNKIQRPTQRLSQSAPTRPPPGNRQSQRPQSNAQDAVRPERPTQHQPFCTWINEPPEPEELPPDWRPPPEPPPLPDDPPF